MFKQNNDNNDKSFNSDTTDSLEMESINKETKTSANQSNTKVLEEMFQKIKSHIDGKQVLTIFQVEKCLKDINRMNLKSPKLRNGAEKLKSSLRTIFKQIKSFEDKIVNIQEDGSANRNFSLDCGISEDIMMLDDHINNLLNPTILMPVQTEPQDLPFDTNMLTNANFLTDDNQGINKIADFLPKGDSDMLKMDDVKIPNAANLCKDVTSPSKQPRSLLLSPDEIGIPIRYVKKSTLSPQNDALFRKPSFIYKKIFSSSQRSDVAASNLSLNKDNNPKNTCNDFVNAIPDDPNATNDSNPPNDPEYSSKGTSDSIPLNDSANVANIIPDSNPTDNWDYSMNCGIIPDDFIPLNHCQNKIDIIIPDSNPTNDWEYSMDTNEFTFPDFIPMNDCENIANNVDSNSTNNWEYYVNLIPDSKSTNRETSPNFIRSSTEEEISKSASNSNSTESEDLSYKDPNFKISPNNSVNYASASTTGFNFKNDGEKLCATAGKYLNTSKASSGPMNSINVAKKMAVVDPRKNIQDLSYLGSRKPAIAPERLEETIFLKDGKASEISPVHSSKKDQKLGKDGWETKNASNLQRGNDVSKLEPPKLQFSDHVPQDLEITESNSDDEDEETLKASFKDWLLVLQEVKQEPGWSPRFLKLW